MLTGMVNIAVFAVFHMRFDLRLVPIAEFKPPCAIRQLAVWRYGRQKRQERQRLARLWAFPMLSRRPDAGLPASAAGVFAGDMRLCMVLAARSDVAWIELKYHKENGKSSGEPNPLPPSLAGKGLQAEAGGGRRGRVASGRIPVSLYTP